MPTLFLAWPILSLWWWRRCVPPKLRLLQELHDVTSHKTAPFLKKIEKRSSICELAYAELKNYTDSHCSSNVDVKLMQKLVPRHVRNTMLILLALYLPNFYFYLYICGAGVEPSPLLLRPFVGLFYQTWAIDGDDCGAIGGMNECRESEVLRGYLP
jgi:hypothetical protein